MLPFPSSPPSRRSISPSHLLERPMDSDQESDPFTNHSSEIEAEIFEGFANVATVPEGEELESETQAYHSLVNEGGRPSHPLSLVESIISAPGQYRDILAFWQEQTDEWQVFTKQLSRWKIHIEKQNKLATWIEYINYELTRRDEYDKWLETCQPGYDAALAQLMDAQVLGPFEQVRTPTSDICRPSSLEIARLRDERRRAEEACETAKDRLSWRDPRRGPRTAQQMEREQRLFTEARERLRMINKRGYVISDFARKTHAYRFAQDRSERHELLLRWAMDQIPLIEDELRKEDQLAFVADLRGVPPSQDQVVERSFPVFQQLPPEIRHRIWGELIPRSPSVHFFDVLNHQRRRHLASYWSTEEFRVRATTSRDSGYLSVYTLLATCRESRHVVETYYMCRRRGIKCPVSGGSITFSEQPPDFRTFDWIPYDDMIVLNFPPKQVTHLPAGNAFTLSPGPGQAARRIGACVPAELLTMNQFSPADEGEGDDDAAQIALIPYFIDKLHRPVHPDHETDSVSQGIWKLYLVIEGWVVNHMLMQLSMGLDTDIPLERWHNGGEPGGRAPPGEPIDRQLWWLGSGDSALSSIDLGDAAQKGPGEKLREFMETLAQECDLLPWHKGFEGVEALGWMEPAGMDIGRANPWDLVDAIRNRGGRPLAL
ncbi:hypothetical protein TrVFT333_002739 [Trichoderma virens FT-333]|nr:hypothetical protein TrVFT333_002739 [Trichoderma virens FT-333]